MNENPQKAPYLPLQRNFIQKSQEKLSEVIDKSYIEIASRVNERSIGLYSDDGNALVTGDKYYIKGQPRSSQRQMYMINSNANVPASIPHNIVQSNVAQITKMYGQYTDGTGNWYALQPGTTIAVAGQLTFYLDPNYINFLAGAAAPVLTTGTIVIEWINNQ